MSIHIRRTEPSDAPAIRDMFLQASVYGSTLQLPYPSVEMWQQRLASIPENVHSFVALIDDDIVGNLGLTVSPRERLHHSANFGMAVKVGFQGMGVGSALLAAAIDLADNWLNLRRLELTVFTDNKPAIALYKKFGFEIEGEARDFAFRNGTFVNAYYMARIKNADYK